MRIGNFRDTKLELSPDAYGEVDLTRLRHAQIASLHLSDEFSDVEIQIAGVNLPAHRCILASSCDYFKILFFGGMKEQFESVIVVNDAPLAAFKAILKSVSSFSTSSDRYIYTGKLALHEHSEDLLDILGLAHKYGLLELQDNIAEFLNVSFALFFKFFFLRMKFYQIMSARFLKRPDCIAFSRL